MSWLKADAQTKLRIVESVRAILVDRAASMGETSIVQGGGSPLYVLSTVDYQSQLANPLRLFNEHFDSHFQALIIRRDDYQAIEEMALAVAETSLEHFMGGVLKDFTGSVIQSDEDSIIATGSTTPNKNN